MDIRTPCALIRSPGTGVADDCTVWESRYSIKATSALNC